MEDPYAVRRIWQQHSDGYRTPAIEDDNHPLNLWRSRQTSGGIIDTHYLPQDGCAKEQLDRFRQSESRSAFPSGQPRCNSTIQQDDLPWRERLKHTTWAYFTMCMATGGLANALHAGTLPTTGLQLPMSPLFGTSHRLQKLTSKQYHSVQIGSTTSALFSSSLTSFYMSLSGRCFLPAS